MGLEHEAASQRRERERDKIATADGPRQKDKAEERQEHGDRLPRLKQRFAAHRPAEAGGEEHGQRPRQRPTPSVREDGDPQDGRHVDDRHADRQSGTPSEDPHGQRQEIQLQRAGMV